MSPRLFVPALRRPQAYARLTDRSCIVKHAARRHATNGPAPEQQRISRVLDRLPRFLHRYTSGLRHAPVSHVAAFLILHELTAVVPLIGLATVFHYTQWLPAWFAEGQYIADGIERFGRYFRRKGWFGFTPDDSTPDDPAPRHVRVWHASEKGSRILVEVATAYAITKLLLPARIVLSVALTPWFARVAVGRVGGVVGRVIRRVCGKKTAKPQ